MQSREKVETVSATILVNRGLGKMPRPALKIHSLNMKKYVKAVCICLLVYEIGICFQKFFSYPTYYETENLHQSKSKFPDVTICSAIPGGVGSVILKVMCVSQFSIYTRANPYFDFKYLMPFPESWK